ncbi:anti-phage ZorAB system protein ZorA [Azospirillum halopraeferens]|uniref:anti-phage ZorAB system protein ZorA n=1 Tax=Azospirillum halopraeferens TaxID=34010 RepID=UPI00041AA9EC|nr:anti-phage ZorAB system protein ZorA [Azospirillum halopraeferens]
MQALSEYLNHFLHTPWALFGIQIGIPPRIILATIAVLALWFMFRYLLPGLWFRFVMGRLPGRIERLKRQQGNNVAPEDVAALMRQSRTLIHLWSEYADTLHEQYQVIDGERRRIAVRATVPAEAYFNTQVLVDTPLRTEFFKHLPGILTGIGIIGTFYGLVTGLAQFNVQLEPERLQDSISHLMDAVKEAFVASGAAILVAMLITGIEKLLLAGCYRVVEHIAQSIDALYAAGAGEEYLARLVQSAEESAVQTRHLKDSLVDDLRQLLTELTDRQIEAGRQHGESVAGSVGGAIRESLHEPIQALTAAVGKAQTEAGEASHKILGDLMAAFMEKLDGTVGGQMMELQRLMAGTTGAIDGMQRNFADLLARMEKTSGDAGEKMTEQMARMMAEAEQRQRQMNEALISAVRDMRQQVTGGQQDLHAQMATTLDTLRQTLQEMLVEIRRQREEASQATERDLATVRESLTAAAEAMREATREIGQSASDQVIRLLQEAEARQASLSETLTRALDEMGRRVSDSNGAVQEQTTGALSAIQTAMGAMLDEIRRQREETTKATQDDMAALRENLAAAADAMRKASEEIGQSASDQAIRLLEDAEKRQAALAETLGQLAADVNANARVANEENASRVRELFTHAEQWQQASDEKARAAQKRADEELRTTLALMSERFGEFLNGTQEREKQQAEAVGTQLKTTLDTMSQRLGEFLRASEEREKRQAQAMDEQQAALSRRTAEVLEALDRRLSELAAGSSRAVQAMQNAIESLNGATGRAIDGMNRGAETMRSAADGFTRAGERMEATVDRSGDLLNRIVDASSSLDASVRAVESVVASYNGTRDALQGLAATLQGLVQDADQRAGVSRELVATMQRIVTDFEQVQQETGEYLENVNEVLRKGFDSFADAVSTNMRRSHGEFHASLADAVQMISGQIQELESVLTGFTTRMKALA